MQNQTCCFTGHRDIPENEYPAIQKRLESEIINLIHQGVTIFKTGGALGFDTMAALAVLKLRAEYPHIRLILVLPCKDQAKGWSDPDKKVYDKIREKADEVVYTSEQYYQGCMHQRNRRLIDDSGICLCYLTGNRGGTAYTVEYAQKKGVRIINLRQILN